MDLFRNQNPQLARYVARHGLLETPLVLLDAGVQGGIDPKWLPLGDSIRIYGFDPIRELIDALKDQPGTYLPIALGNEDSERDFFVMPDRFGSSFYPSTDAEKRVVPVRKIDTLIRDGVIEPPDFIKLDCEGAEPEILAGAGEFLTRRTLVGLESETSFGVSVNYPKSHFCAVHEPLVARGLTMFDLAFDRAPRPIVSRMEVRPPGIARPNTFNMLFCRDFAYDKGFAVPWEVIPPTTDQILKLAIVFELYGLNDCAYDTLNTFPQIRELIPPHRVQRLLLWPG